MVGKRGRAVALSTLACIVPVRPPAAMGFCLPGGWNVPRMSASDKLDHHVEGQHGITRTAALTALGSATLFVTAGPCAAAIPTTDDYAIGSGSKISKRAPGQSQSSAAVNPKNLLDVMEAVSGELDRMESLVKSERWGDALSRLRSFPLSAIKSPTLGLGSVGDVARSLGVSNAKATEILEASMEAGLTLRQVEDVVFSNTRTLEFFNSADLKQLEDLKKSAKPTDLSEPLELLADTKTLVEGVRDMMSDSDSGML